MSTPNDGPNSPGEAYTLGIDLGVSSLGAALIDPGNQRIIWAGVRIFAPGFEGDYESGMEKSRAEQRRLARQQRRQTDRRRRRRLNIFRLLQQYGLLPAGARETILPALDAETQARYPETHALPYFLRARALDTALEPYELGRALYHLAQRRGFRGRAVREAGDEDGGKLRKDIEGLWKEITDGGSRTLGEHLSKLNSEESRLRGRHTHRRMYEEEFEAIWEAQRPHHPHALSKERKPVLRRALFDQRPLKPSDHLVGMCDLERDQRRAPLWMPAVQHYRVLTAVNNLRLIERNGDTRSLTPREREILIEQTHTKEKMAFVQVRRLLDLEGTRFSVEEGGEKNLPGNATSHRMFKVLGDKWNAMPEDRQQALAALLADKGRDDEEICRTLSGEWGVNPDDAKRLCAVTLPGEYASLSLAAILNRAEPSPTPSANCGPSSSPTRNRSISSRRSRSATA